MGMSTPTYLRYNENYKKESNESDVEMKDQSEDENE